MFLFQANLDKKNINSRWVLVQIFSELPSIVGGDLKKASIYTDEILKILKSKVSWKSKFLHMLKKISLNSSLIILILKLVRYS